MKNRTFQEGEEKYIQGMVLAGVPLEVGMSMLPTLDPEIFDAGLVVFTDKKYKPLPVEYGRHRLRWVIKADREAAQDGRWVEIPQKLGSDEHRRWLEIAIHSLTGPETCQSRMAFRKLKPHYRWQVRR